MEHTKKYKLEEIVSPAQVTIMLSFDSGKVVNKMFLTKSTFVKNVSLRYFLGCFDVINGQRLICLVVMELCFN